MHLTGNTALFLRKKGCRGGALDPEKAPLHGENSITDRRAARRRVFTKSNYSWNSGFEYES